MHHDACLRTGSSKYHATGSRPHCTFLGGQTDHVPGPPGLCLVSVARETIRQLRYDRYESISTT